VEAQVRIAGRVIADDTDAPLPNVVVTARSTTGRFLRQVETDAEGRFAFIVQRVGAVVLRANHEGYQASTAPVLEFEGHTSFDVEMRLNPRIVLLAPLEVVGRSVDASPFLDNFRERVRQGRGVFITRAEIERRGPMYVTDLLRDVPGVHLASAGSGNRPVVQMARAAGQACPTRIFIDGLLLNPTMMTSGGPRSDVFRIDDIVAPGSVEGIEVYRGSSTVPPEFLTSDVQCGVIAIWTRRGGR
jgi:hypothetical protein